MSVILKSGETVFEPIPLLDSPWLTVYHPQSLWRFNPSHIVIEGMWYLVALLTLIHALRSSSRLGRPLGLWFGVLVGSVIFELNQIGNPQVGNTYFTQSTVMVHHRLEPLERLLMAGMAGCYSFAIFPSFDIAGYHFMWNTFHESEAYFEPAIAEVQIAGTYFMAALAASAAFVYSYTKSLGTVTSMAANAVLLPVLPGCMTMIFLLMLKAFQMPFLPFYVLEVFCVACALIAALQGKMLKFDSLLALSIGSLVTCYATWLLFSPSKQTNMRFGYGQAFVNYDCRAEFETSTWGLLSRGKFLCPQRMRPDLSFNFDCLQSFPEDHSTWYWSCGVPVPEGVDAEMRYLFVRAFVGILSLKAVSHLNKDKRD
ncbi:hypothetical protein FOL47_001499 [Perkinsus chesapeaki]|uniref:Uncharacterized protein n=1 Tax=Perkinsus chesapeaki TaxID=330153 RepID=A0A7J6MJA7_PERCH|nr:hypothetical protein FOL47_001499 [Perkinsus chesapeaki]